MNAISIPTLVLFLVFSALSFSQEAPIDRNIEVDKAYSKLLTFLPEGAQLIHVPYADQLQSYGSNHTLTRINDADVTGGKLVQLHVKGAGVNSWDDAVISNIGGEIKKGDVVYVIFWGRISPLDANNDTLVLPAVGVQKSTAPYDKFMATTVELSTSWQTLAMAGKATLDFTNYGSQFTIPISTGKHILEFGPLFVFNLGPDADISTLPFL